QGLQRQEPQEVGLYFAKRVHQSENLRQSHPLARPLAFAAKNKYRNPMTLKISVRRFTLGNVVLITFLFLMSFFVRYEQVVGGHGQLFGLLHLFDMNAKHNLPNYYKILTFLLVAYLSWAISDQAKREGDRYARHWKGLAVVF